MIKRVHGKYLGWVVDNADPKELGRIRAKVPEILGEVPTGWCVPCSPYAGAGCGFAAVPPRDSLVFVEWTAGDTARVPIWSGGMWSGGEEIAFASRPDTVALVTPGKNRVLLRDTAGTEAIEIESASGAKVVLDADGVSISFGSQRVAVTRSVISFNDGALEVRR